MDTDQIKSGLTNLYGKGHRITLGLDDCAKANYGKVGNLVAERKSITGQKD